MHKTILSRFYSITSRKKQDSPSTKEETILSGPKNCSEIKIGDFIDTLCGDKPRIDHWEEIFDEYLKLTNTNQNNALLELMKLAVIYENRYIEIQVLCSAATIDPDHESSEDINSLLRSATGVRVKGRMTQAELNRHQNVARSYAAKASSKREEIKKLDVKSESATKKDWLEQLSLLGKYQGYRIDPESVSTLEYISVLNNFKRENKPKPIVKGYGRK